MNESSRQIANVVAALRDVESALGAVNVQIARREERGEALSLRVTEMQSTLRELSIDLHEGTKQRTGNSHNLMMVDATIQRLHADVSSLKATLEAHPLPCPDRVHQAQFEALTTTVNQMDTDLKRVLEALGLDEPDAKEPGLAASIRENRMTLRNAAALGAAIVVVAGLLLVLLKSTGLLQGFLFP